MGRTAVADREDPGQEEPCWREVASPQGLCKEEARASIILTPHPFLLVSVPPTGQPKQKPEEEEEAPPGDWTAS